MQPKVINLFTREVVYPPEDRTIRSFVNPRMTIEPGEFGLWMRIDGRTQVGNDPYLWISKRPGSPRGSYHVRGVYGWAGMGYNGNMSTRKLLQGLRRLGFQIDAQTLRGMLLKAPAR